MPYKDPVKNREASRLRVKKWLQTDKGKATRRRLSLAYYHRNKDKILEKKRPNYKVINAKSRAYRLDYALRKRYGITTKQYEEMKEKQDGKCAICHNVPERLVVDHNHTTGKVRELLCDACNFALGALKEDVLRFEAAITYIQKHQEKNGSA